VTDLVVGVDLRQFFSRPYATGVQRVLLCLLENWPRQRSTLAVMCGSGNDLFFIDGDAAVRCIRAVFDFTGEYSDTNDNLKRVVDAQLELERRTATRWPEALLMVDRWLVAEPTANEDILHQWGQAKAVMPTTLIFYDALPQTDPEFFKTNEVIAASAFSRFAAEVECVVSISQSASNTLVDRLGNKHPGASLVALPGADHIPITTSIAPRRTSFLVLSSVEKRKRLGTVVEAFRIARKDGPDMALQIVGRSSSDSSIVHDASEAPNSRIRWSRSVNDLAMDKFAAESTALISIGQEGYGLPALEMLRRGCPVLFAGGQPAAELAEGKGARRLPDHSVASVSQAMIELADRRVADGFRAEIDPYVLPTWADFATRVASAASAR
jgi:glycosyltransferase involved in cell wall biosynthesis